MPLNDAYDKADDVVFPLLHETRMLGNLAPYQCAAGLAATFGDAGNKVVDEIGIGPAERDGVQEEQWLCALGGDVIDAHGNDIDADRVVLSEGPGDNRLRASAVCAQDEHGVLNALDC